ncbi:hypothetical protein FPSE_08006 [Fusarium pseudograminearum CS3096]|uniref:Uncharacterized protein n=1 Tax=Fusarium pseudograminearum (strain CS3096) TaxID=1028729 RepID=K3UIY0_FUSPC|nr:hypothetical protein FPSE_08006 [Fusarium pseudograminearum CS3096]EKJ71821.1 hypothetical protein FPSE_08006 [Fusarium pseudograminearum CS3096]KAF0635481.1 hypothetical protein FPSE5266_08006 [Fusarium pseudograminearum]
MTGTRLNYSPLNPVTFSTAVVLSLGNVFALGRAFFLPTIITALRRLIPQHHHAAFPTFQLFNIELDSLPKPELAVKAFKASQTDKPGDRALLIYTLQVVLQQHLPKSLALKNRIDSK